MLFLSKIVICAMLSNPFPNANKVWETDWKIINVIAHRHCMRQGMCVKKIHAWNPAEGAVLVTCKKVVRDKA